MSLIPTVVHEQHVPLLLYPSLLSLKDHFYIKVANLINIIILTEDIDIDIDIDIFIATLVYMVYTKYFAKK